jgi:hypothetical protein
MTLADDRRVAVGVFEFRDKADAAVTALERSGFSYADIGVIAKRTSEWNDGLPSAPKADDTVATGAAVGAAAGAGVGGLWALGIAAGVMPVIGPVVAGGVLGSILASAAAGAAAGGVGGALIGSGISEDDVHQYYGDLAAGRIIVTVRAGERYDNAVAILDDNGAISHSAVAPMTTRRAVT